ncbi:MAG: SDR family oxidoreductase [Thermoleophilia bacterium]
MPSRNGSRAPRRVVVVTGASAGVGRATVEELAREGCAIALLARGRERLERAAAEVERLGGVALVLPVDVADEDAVEAAADAAEERLGPIDVWINNAMATVFAPTLAITPAEFRRATEVTYLGSVWGTRAALRRMRPRDRGVIVQVGSALAYRGIPLQGPYCGAKHALEGFLDAVRTELLHERSRVRVTRVQLPALNTPQFSWGRSRMPRQPQPVPPIFQPEVAARAIVWASHHPRRELQVGWPTVKAIAGDKLAPGLADHFLARNGVDAQQSDAPVPPDRPDNLFEPGTGDWGAHGAFDDRARDRSLELWAATHRGWVALGLAGAALAATLARRAR